MRVLLLLLLCLGSNPPGEVRAQEAAPMLPLQAQGVRAPRYEPVVPSRAMMMSPVFTGWGQLYADNGWRAVLAFGVEAYYLSHVLMNDRKARRLQAYNQRLGGSLDAAYRDQVTEYWELMRDNAWKAVGALFFITVDAYVGAHLHRFDVDPEPVPDNWDPGEVPQPIELPAAASPDGTVLISLGGRF